MNEINICYFTEEIKNSLQNSINKKWKQQENPNCFISNYGEALYIYDNKIKYWEDIRNQSVVNEHKILNSLTEINDFLKIIT